MPNGATVSALSGVGKPGHRGHGGLDSDIVRTRDAAADPDSFAGPGETVIGSSSRDGVHQIFAGKHADGGLALALSASEFRVSRMRSRTMPARRTPPLKRMWVGAANCGALLAEELREMASDRRIGGVRQADFLQADTPSCLRHVLTGNLGEEAVEQHAVRDRRG